MSREKEIKKQLKELNEELREMNNGHDNVHTKENRKVVESMIRDIKEITEDGKSGGFCIVAKKIETGAEVSMGVIAENINGQEITCILKEVLDSLVEKQKEKNAN